MDSIIPSFEESLQEMTNLEAKNKEVDDGIFIRSSRLNLVFVIMRRD
jgi:hypothetical protein